MLKIIEESYILAYFGIFCTFLLVVFLLLKLFNMLKIHLFSRCSSNLIKCGQWSVITGGSSGIGKGYAIELAKLGFDIMIISNELEALKDTVKEIRNDYGVRCRYIHVDLTEENAIEFLSKGMCDIDIGVLINCAGILGNFPSYFLDETDINTYKIMALNISAVVNTIQLVLPSMLAKKKGVIVNISSMASATPFPCVSVYSASKAFSDRFIRGLYYENQCKGISFQSVTPSIVLTRCTQDIFKTFPKLKIFSLDADCFARNAVKTISHTNHTTGYWLNEFNWYIYANIPFFIWFYLIEYLFKFLKKK